MKRYSQAGRALLDLEPFDRDLDLNEESDPDEIPKYDQWRKEALDSFRQLIEGMNSEQRASLIDQFGP